MAADLAILGATIRTLDPTQPFATAVAARDGIITAVGDDPTIRQECDARTTLIDGAGMFITPGLVDAHMHPFSGAISTQGVDLTEVKSITELRDTLARAHRGCAPDDWITGWGLRYEPFADTGIRGDLFDTAVEGRPTILTFYDYHTAVATPAAVAAAGVTAPMTFSDNSAIVWDTSGPTGELREGAVSIIMDAAPEPTAEQRYRWYVEAMRRMNAMGLTGAHGMDGTPETLDLLRQLEANGDLSLRLIMPLWQKPETTWEDMRAQLPHRDEHGRRWRGGVAKFFIDGVIESGTGWMIEPDTDGECRDPFWPDPTRYAEAVRLFAEAGFQCATHACGDMAVRCALDAYRAAGSAPGVHHRIEHIEVLSDQDLPRFAAEGVVASMQPLHAPPDDADPSGEWVRRVGPERTRQAFRFGELHASGATLALGSDWPVVTVDPRPGLSYVRHLRASQDDANATPSPRALSGLDALIGYTLAPARAVWEDHISGRVAVGYRADLSGFAADPVEVSAKVLETLPIKLTIVDGEGVYKTD